MSSLFNISSRYASVLKLIDDYTDWEPDTDAEGHYLDENNEIIDDLVEYRQQLTDALLDTLDAVDGEMTDKLANCGAFVKQLTAEAGALDAEIKSLRQRSASKKREIERFKKYIINRAIEADFPLSRNSEFVNELADRLSNISKRRPNKNDLAAFAKREGIDTKSE